MEITLLNGQCFEAKLTYRNLYILQTNRPKDYEEYNRICMNGTTTEMDYLRLLYTAYLCNANEPDLTFEDFLDNLKYDRKYLHIAGKMLSAPKKRSESPSIG